MICLCLGRRGMDDGYTYGMQPSSARASVASSEGYGPNRASRSTHEDAFGGGDPLGESPLHSAIHSSTSLPSCMNSFVLAFFYQITYRLLIDLVTFSLFVHSFLSVSESVSQSDYYYGTSQSCSASCVCVQHMCHPQPANALCLCQKKACRKLHDLPNAHRTCCEVRYQLGWMWLMLKHANPAAMAKVLQPLGIGLTLIQSKCCPVLHYNMGRLHRSIAHFRPEWSSFNVLAQHTMTGMKQ
jgi:hypothetical protein